MLIIYANLSLNTSAYLIILNIKWHQKSRVKFIMPLSILVFNMELKFIVIVLKHTQIDCKLYKINF